MSRDCGHPAPAAIFKRFEWVLELRVLPQEHEVDVAGWAVALLGDDQLCLASQVFAVAIVDLFAIDERHHIRVLFDRT